MTLILTAVCKNGVCVCADTRYRITNNGIQRIEDGYEKIYKFIDRKISLIIFNHGINKFNNTDWRDLCVAYINTNAWKNKNIKEICEGFRLFIKDKVEKELKAKKNSNTSGFILCGKTSLDENFDIYELWWDLRDPTEPIDRIISLKTEGLIKTGDGKKCLDVHIVEHGELNERKYWNSMSIEETTLILTELFNIAKAEKKRINSEEFSDDYHTESIEFNQTK